MENAYRDIGYELETFQKTIDNIYKCFEKHWSEHCCSHHQMDDHQCFKDEEYTKARQLFKKTLEDNLNMLKELFKAKETTLCKSIYDGDVIPRPGICEIYKETWFQCAYMMSSYDIRGEYFDITHNISRLALRGYWNSISSDEDIERFKACCFFYSAFLFNKIKSKVEGSDNSKQMGLEQIFNRIGSQALEHMKPIFNWQVYCKTNTQRGYLRFTKEAFMEVLSIGGRKSGVFGVFGFLRGEGGFKDEQSFWKWSNKQWQKEYEESRKELEELKVEPKSTSHKITPKKESSAKKPFPNEAKPENPWQKKTEEKKMKQAYSKHEDNKDDHMQL